MDAAGNFRGFSPTPQRAQALNHLVGSLWFRSTIGFRKTGGIWRITHEHNSTPFYMDGSDKAALNLQP